MSRAFLQRAERGARIGAAEAFAGKLTHHTNGPATIAEYLFWIGLLAPRKKPRSAITRLNSDIQKAIGTAELRERFPLLGAEPLSMTSEALDAFLAAGTEAAGRIGKAANIKPQ